MTHSDNEQTRPMIKHSSTKLSLETHFKQKMKSNGGMATNDCETKWILNKKIRSAYVESTLLITILVSIRNQKGWQKLTTANDDQCKINTNGVLNDIQVERCVSCY